MVSIAGNHPLQLITLSNHPQFTMRLWEGGTMSSQERIEQKKCDVCGEHFDLDDDRAIEVLRLPYSAAQVLERKYPEILGQLERCDGKLTFHEDCEHPIEELLSTSASRISGTGQVDSGYESESNLTDCPVCRMSEFKYKDECQRCGSPLD